MHSTGRYPDVACRKVGDVEAPSGWRPIEFDDRSRALDEVLADLAALSAELQTGLPPTCDLAHALAEVGRLVDEPLRVAVLSRTGSGPIELVEALLGRRVIGPDRQRRIRGPIWFRFDDVEHIVVTGHGGERNDLLPLPAPDGDWPDSQGVRSLDVWLRAPELHGLSLVVHDDVPDDVVSAAVLVDQDPCTPHALDLLARFHDRNRGLEHTAFAAMAVLRADRITVDEAVERARELTPQATSAMSLVLPVILAMAHTARVGALDTAAAEALREMLTVDDVERRLDLGGRIDPRVETLLSAEGVRRCLPRLRDSGPGPGGIRTAMLAGSGFPELEAAIRDRWLAHGSALKIASVVGLLARADARAVDDPHPAVPDARRRLRIALPDGAAVRQRCLDQVQVLHLLDALDLGAADIAEARRLFRPRPRIRLAGGSGVSDTVDALVLRWQALAEHGIGGRTQRWAASVVLGAAEALREHIHVTAPPARWPA